MEFVEFHQRASVLLAQWDPFQLSYEGAYDVEIADVLRVMPDEPTPAKLAEQIQRIYEHSYIEWIPFEQCERVAEQLFELRDSIRCDR
ncbi:MAG TPA: DUF1871 family protein [Savagea sp.]